MRAPRPSGGDDSPMLNELFRSGEEIRFSAGVYRLLSPLTHETTTQLAPSLSIRGAGRYETVFDLQVPGYAMTFRSSVPGNFQVGLTVEDIGITTTAGEGYRSGICLIGVYQATLRNIRIEGMTAHGLGISSPLGDPDASVNVTLDNCWLWNNSLYGVASLCGANTANVSYLSIRSSSIQGNLGAGIYWTGAMCSIRDTGIAANKGLGGLYVDYTGAHSMNLECSSATFENNSPRHIDIRALVASTFINMDFRHTQPVAFPATDAVRLTAASGALVSPPLFIGPNLFAVPGYMPYTFFPGSTSAKLLNPYWRESPGQSRGMVIEL